MKPITRAKLRHLFWHFVTVLTAVPFVHDYAANQELKAAKDIFSAWYDMWMEENIR